MNKNHVPSSKYVPFIHPLPCITHLKWYFSANSVIFANRNYSSEPLARGYDIALAYPKGPRCDMHEDFE